MLPTAGVDQEPGVASCALLYRYYSSFTGSLQQQCHNGVTVGVAYDTAIHNTQNSSTRIIEYAQPGDVI